MGRKRVGGRSAAVDGSARPLAGFGGRSRGGRALKAARETLVAAVPAVATKLAADAMAGSVPHMKLMLQMLGLEDGGVTPQKTAKREKTLEEIVTEQWNREP